MRMLEIPYLSYDKYRGILDTILEEMAFCLLNSEYSLKFLTGYFYFWDASYIPESLMKFAKFPPKTHENVELLNKKIEELLK